MINEKHQKLIDALRSGKYPQIKGALRDNCGYCVMGVGCDVYDPTRWSSPLIDQGNYYYEGVYSVIPSEVDLYYGFSGEFMNKLVSLNDGGVMDFNQLADFIESSIKDGSAFNE